MTEWQEIETAPREQNIVVWAENEKYKGPVIVEYSEFHDCWYSFGSVPFSNKQVKCWMPTNILDEPPASLKSSHKCKKDDSYCYSDDGGHIILVTKREGELERRTFCNYCPFCGEPDVLTRYDNEKKN